MMLQVYAYKWLYYGDLVQWFEELQQVSFDHKYPAKKEPIVTNSMKFKHETPTKPKDRRSWTESLF